MSDLPNDIFALHGAELFNGLSMLVPFAVSLRALDNACSAWVGVAFALICPVSMMLHLGAFLGCIGDVVDNNVRRADQSLQCVACVLVCVGLGGGFGEVAVTALIASYALFFVWHSRFSNDRLRWAPISLGTVFSFTPMLAHGQFFAFARVVSVFVACGVFFTQKAQWYFAHAVFHLLIGVMVMELAEAAAEKC